MSERKFNLIRTERGNVTIFKRGLSEREAFQELKHWKRMARNAGGRAFFKLVELPAEIKTSVCSATLSTPMEAHP